MQSFAVVNSINGPNINHRGAGSSRDPRKFGTRLGESAWRGCNARAGNMPSKRQAAESYDRWAAPIAVLVALACVAVQALILLAMGHPAICSCGYVKAWHGVVESAENSQHLFDWYTFSHVIHGFGFYLLLWLVAPRMPIAWRFVVAIGLEAGWEVIENTPLIMDRYRQTALAKGYFGDSAINSVFDTLAAAAGFVLARLLPVWLVVALTIALEVFVVSMIRDNLTLNIIQLVWPTEAVSRWQMGG
jgi:hypothetical protein